LSQDAARKTFIDIADNIHDIKDIDKILLLTDNMPLAIYLLAHLVESEGCANVLSRWEEERTFIISEGHDKRSNLNLSISLSLSSPRLTSLPNARDLLSLLSMLPDGLSDVELRLCKIPIDDILTCKAALLGTSLAYNNDQRRIKTLVPIREYVHKFHPPKGHLLQPLFIYYKQLLEVYQAHRGTLSDGVAARIASNFANIQNILLNGLHQSNPDLVDIIYCTSYLDLFSVSSGRGSIISIKLIQSVLPQPSNHRLEISVITRVLLSWKFHAISNPEALVNQAKEHLKHFDDADLECMFPI
jgi:hypothetical protein